MENKKKKTKIVIIVLVVAIILLAGGITISYLTSAKYVAKKAVKLMSENAVELANSGKTETGLEENFNTTSTIKVNIEEQKEDNTVIASTSTNNENDVNTDITDNSINTTNTTNTLDSQNASNTLGGTVLLGLLGAGGYFGYKKLKEKE